MTGYERPTDKGKAPTKVSFWAELWRPSPPDSGPSGKGNVHGQAKISPKFATQSDLTAWLRANRNDGDEVSSFRRTSREGGFDDEKLVARDEEPLPDKERVRKVVEELKEIIKNKKKVLDTGYGPSKPAPRPAKTMDPLETRALTYFEVYDEEGNPRFAVNPDGWPA